MLFCRKLLRKIEPVQDAAAWLISRTSHKTLLTLSQHSSEGIFQGSTRNLPFTKHFYISLFSVTTSILRKFILMEICQFCYNEILRNMVRIHHFFTSIFGFVFIISLICYRNPTQPGAWQWAWAFCLPVLGFTFLLQLQLMPGERGRTSIDTYHRYS